MKKINVALLCYTYQHGKEQNLHKISRLLEEVKKSDFVLLPEDSVDPDSRYSEEIPGEVTRWLQKEAQTYSVNIIGNLTERAGDSFFDTCVLIDRKGRLAGTYRKIQLSHSDKTVRKLSPGSSLPVFHLDGIPFGICICYDAWYPETIRHLVLNGALLVFVPFREESLYIPYLRSLLSARAIENVIPLVGCGAEGYSRRFGRRYKSFAFFILPSGKIIKEETKKEHSVYTFPSLDMLIKKEKARMKWNRPFDRVLDFKR